MVLSSVKISPPNGLPSAPHLRRVLLLSANGSAASITSRQMSSFVRLALAALAGLLICFPARAEPPDTAVAQYRRSLAVYQQAYAAYERRASAYWEEVAAKRRIRI